MLTRPVQQAASTSTLLTTFWVSQTVAPPMKDGVPWHWDAGSQTPDTPDGAKLLPVILDHIDAVE
jgi:hypothetical protein